MKSPALLRFMIRPGLFLTRKGRTTRVEMSHETKIDIDQNLIVLEGTVDDSSALGCDSTRTSHVVPSMTRWTLSSNFVQVLLSEAARANSRTSALNSFSRSDLTFSSLVPGLPWITIWKPREHNYSARPLPAPSLAPGTNAQGFES